MRTDVLPVNTAMIKGGSLPPSLCVCSALPRADARCSARRRLVCGEAGAQLRQGQLSRYQLPRSSSAPTMQNAALTQPCAARRRDLRADGGQLQRARVQPALLPREQPEAVGLEAQEEEQEERPPGRPPPQVASRSSSALLCAPLRSSAQLSSMLLCCALRCKSAACVEYATCSPDGAYAGAPRRLLLRKPV
eukprot:1080503-Rhodomonas_salina.1